MKLFTLRALLLLALATAPLASLRAHGALDEQIAIVTARIDRTPTAALYLQRGELYRADEEYASALHDYDRAAALDPKLAAVHLCRGLTLHRTGQDEAARAALDRFLTLKPDHAEGHATRARILSDRHDHAAATADLQRAIALSAEPAPELFIDCAAAQSALGDQVNALATLEAGMARLGRIMNLDSAALDLELRLGRHAVALARLDRIMAPLARKEIWQARRGDILHSLGRHNESLAAYREALASLERLAPTQRHTRPAKALEARLRSAFGEPLERITLTQAASASK